MNKLIKSVVFLAACSLVFAGCEKKNKKGSNNSSDQQNSQQTDNTPSGGGGEGGSQLLDDEITLTVADKVYDGHWIDRWYEHPHDYDKIRDELFYEYYNAVLQTATVKRKTEKLFYLVNCLSTQEEYDKYFRKEPLISK